VPYEHESVESPLAPSWTRHPLASDAVWIVSASLVLATLLLNGGPLWVIALYAALLSALAVVAVRRQTLRRRGHSG
jgi:type III secretory pathway component EscV